MNKLEMIQTISKLIKQVSDVEETTAVCVGGGTSIMDDLDMESLEVFALLGEIEKTYHITVPTRLLVNIRTVGELADLVAERIGQ